MHISTCAKTISQPQIVVIPNKCMTMVCGYDLKFLKSSKWLNKLIVKPKLETVSSGGGQSSWVRLVNRVSFLY